MFRKALPLMTAVWLLFVMFLSTASNGAVGDHLFWVNLDHVWDYGNASNSEDTSYNFTIELTTDSNVVEIRFLTPGGNTFVIPNSSYTYDPNTKTKTRLLRSKP